LPYSGVSVVFKNDSDSSILSSSTNSSGYSSSGLLVVYQNIRGVGVFYNYTADYTQSGVTRSSTFLSNSSVANGGSIPYWFSIDVDEVKMGITSLVHLLCGTVMTIAWCLLLFLMFWIPLRAGYEFEFSFELLVYLIVAVAIIAWMINFSYGVCGV